ncbi:MAG: class I SAM-dependent methyltransferase [Lachnospiraceae bacterium]|nr:class I SAM-dependent methyltransferase [Lachnospiraceae bacterium]
MSTNYHTFAYVYDKFMNNIPYQEWAQYLKELFQQYNIPSGNLVELGCGTATLALLLEAQGYCITGVDNSEDMLSLASEKLTANHHIQLILQDMCELDLPNYYDGIYCVCDSLNYLLSEEEIAYTFQGVRNHLKENGIFIFDLKTIHFYQNILGDQIFCDHQEDCSYIWENSFFEEDNVNQYDLTLFVKQSQSNLYEKFNEVHHQRGYELEEIIDLLNVTGLEYVTAYDAFTSNPPTATSKRIYIIARNGDIL